MWAVLSVAALIVAVGIGQVVLTLAARDRLAHDYEAVAAAEEALATQQQAANWATALGLDPTVRARLQTTCRQAVTAYNRDAHTTHTTPLNPAAHCR
jgi:hypothetical protein